MFDVSLDLPSLKQCTMILFPASSQYPGCPQHYMWWIHT